MPSRVSREVLAYRFALSILFDLADFGISAGFLVLSSLPLVGGLFFALGEGAGLVFDTLGGFLALWFWGSSGAIAFSEVLLPSSIDGFFPSLTVSGVVSLVRGR